MAETPATLNWVEWMKTCIWILKKIWSLLLSPKCVLKGGLNKKEIFTTDIYYLFFAEFCLSVWKISARFPPVKQWHPQHLCHPCLGCALLRVPRVTCGLAHSASQQSSTELSSLLFWAQVGYGFAKAHSKTLLCPRTVLGKGESNPSQFALGWIFPTTFLSRFSQEHIWQLPGGLLDSPFCFLWIAGMENCMHNMLNTFINFTLFMSSSVPWPLTAAD